MGLTPCNSISQKLRKPIRRPTVAMSPFFPRIYFYLLALPAIWVPSAPAQVVLGVDFGQNDGLPTGTASTSGNRRESGFQQFYLSRHSDVTFTGTAELTYTLPDLERSAGSVTVRIQGDPTGNAGSMGGRNRTAPLDNGDFTYGDLLSDGIVRTKLTSTAGDYTLQILGLNPNQSFHLRLWSASSGADPDTTYSWYDTTLDSRLIGTIFNGPGSPLTATNNNDFSTAGMVTTDANGQLLLGVTSSNNSPTAGYISGFLLSAIPEPSLPTLLTLALLSLTLKRKR